MIRRVRDTRGLLQLSKRAKAYHPGQGVYRSSYKNARRLTATENNIAYRTADYLRYQQMDFVVGIQICLSNNHTVLLQPGETTSDPTQQRADGSPKANAVRPLVDICDDLQGRYPKDFKFTGWHPHCRCHVITILKSKEEIKQDITRLANGEDVDNTSVNEVTELPKNFTEWVKNNEERLKGRATLPYFIKDNNEHINRIMGYVRGSISNSENPLQATPITTLPKTLEALKNAKIKQITPKKLDLELSTEEIISKVGGIDKTSGSCTTLAFAYAANKLGFDVTDFRGGRCCVVFQQQRFTDRLVSEMGGVVAKAENQLQKSLELLATLVEGEEYIFASNFHTAVVRKFKGRIQYLELQNGKDNGFKQISEEILKNRFYCKDIDIKKSIKKHFSCLLISIKDMGKSKDFIDVISFVNTKE